MDYELFAESPDLYLLILLVSLALTVFAYGAFPLIFAKTRRAPITKKKYKALCYGINAIVMCVFCVINCGASIFPYLLWTWVFSRWGLKILDEEAILVEEDQIKGSKDLVKKNGYMNGMPTQTQSATQNIYTTPNSTKTSESQVCRCDVCGHSVEKVTYAKITEDMGVWHKNLCDVCMVICNATPEEKNVTESANIVKQNEDVNKEPSVNTDKICFCRKCGNELTDDSIFCNKCGTKIAAEQKDVDL